MKIETQRRIDRWIGIPLCRLLSLALRLFPRREPPAPRHILVILLSEMGSLVLTQPMFAMLREQHPGATLHVLLFGRNREVLELLGCVPAENMITVRDTSFGVLVRDSLRAVFALRRAGIDTAIDCELFSRISSVFSALSGAAIRSGFHPHTQEGLYRGSFINRPVLYNPHRHIALQFLTLAEAVTATGRPLVKTTHTLPVELPQLARDEVRIAALKDSLARDFPGVTLAPLVLVYPSGGMLRIRAWPEAAYATLCRELCQRGFTVGITGLPGDRPLAQRILAGCPPERRLDLAGYTRTLPDLIALFHLARLLVTNDGGPGHFASVTPLPAIVLFGPETPVLYRPLSPRTVVMFSGLACSPCLTAYNHRNSPCDGNNVCLKQITPGQVLAKATEILGR